MWYFGKASGLIGLVSTMNCLTYPRVSLMGKCDRQVDFFVFRQNWLWQLARQRVIIWAGVYDVESCQPSFEPRAQAFISSESWFR